MVRRSGLIIFGILMWLPIIWGFGNFRQWEIGNWWLVIGTLFALSGNATIKRWTGKEQLESKGYGLAYLAQGIISPIREPGERLLTWLEVAFVEKRKDRDIVLPATLSIPAAWLFTVSLLLKEPLASWFYVSRAMESELGMGLLGFGVLCIVVICIAWAEREVNNVIKIPLPGILFFLVGAFSPIVVLILFPLRMLFTRT